MSVRRQLKNVVKNFSNVEVKVREATSNDPWGPSSSLMSEIADATYNVVAFSEIMGMLWKRLNDHGKNWRHVYKALVVLDYIIKTGSERVAQQCRENIFAIQTLKDFQFIDKDGKDQGMNVREKAKQLVALLKDEERLKSERQRALKAKERFAQASSGIGSDSLRSGRTVLRTSGSSSDIRTDTASSTSTNPTSRSWEPERKVIGSDFETCRPSNSNEEELQLQLALALSKQEAAESEKMKENEEKRVQLAISQSQVDTSGPLQQGTLLSMQSSSNTQMAEASGTFDPWGDSTKTSHTGDPWGTSAAASVTNSWQPQPTVPTINPWGASQATSTQPTVAASALSAAPSADPWGDGAVASQPVATPSVDPWGGPSVIEPVAPSSSDPWGAPAPAPAPNQDVWGNEPQEVAPFSITPGGATTFNGAPTLALQPVPQNQDPFSSSDIMSQKPKPKGTLLQDPTLSSLVDLENLAAKPVPGTAPDNPFITSTQPQMTKSTNPFLADKPAAPSLNELRGGGAVPVAGFPQANVGADVLLPTPLLPDSTTRTQQTVQNNPFL